MKQYLLSVYQPDGDPPPLEVLGPIMAGRSQLGESDLKAARVMGVHCGTAPVEHGPPWCGSPTVTP